MGLLSGRADRAPFAVYKVAASERSRLYESYKARLGARHTTEVRLFHGTSQAAARSIATNGFNLELAGRANGKRYGAGFYTDVEPRVPEDYAMAERGGSVLIMTGAPGRARGTSDATVRCRCSHIGVIVVCVSVQHLAMMQRRRQFCGRKAVTILLTFHAMRTRNGVLL
jgi:hypothetical protein